MANSIKPVFPAWGGPAVKVAIIGSGISGLAAAHTLLRESADNVRVTLFEAAEYFGGHTNTVDVSLQGPEGPVTFGVDTGFLVFNERTYPGLIALFQELGVATAKSDMSFSVQVKNAEGRQTLEWSGTSLFSVFAQRSNLLNWRFMKMLRDLNRFNQLCTALAADCDQADQVRLRESLGDFLNRHQFSQEFRDWYFLPMVACIWSCPTEEMLQFPVATMIRFCHNHGLLQLTDRPQWWTVSGGARHYVDKIVAQISDKRLNTPVLAIERLELAEPGLLPNPGRVKITTKTGVEIFDKVVIATHPDQALAMLKVPSPLELRTLGAIRYHDNRAVLHTDESVLPSRRAAWAAWNYERAQPPAHAVPQGESVRDVCLHYLINKLQPLPWRQSVIVSLNPLRELPASKVLGAFDYSHPVFDAPAIKAQQQLAWLQGKQATYYCGAWCGYGFHEDGYQSGVAAARLALSQVPTRAEEFA